MGELGAVLDALPDTDLHALTGPALLERTAELYLVCDDVDATVSELADRGVVFEGAVSDEGWGRLATIRLPGGGRLGVYEARHATAFDL